MEGGILERISDERFYRAYQISSSGMFEIWKFAAGIVTTEFESNSIYEPDISNLLEKLHLDIADIKDVISKKESHNLAYCMFIIFFKMAGSLVED